LVRAREQLLEQAELTHDVEGRWVNGVAAKVAQEVCVLFEHDDIDSAPGQQQTEHHACRSTACDAALCRDTFGRARGHVHLPGIDMAQAMSGCGHGRLLQIAKVIAKVMPACVSAR
jgi:hypothetical protein